MGKVEARIELLCDLPMPRELLAVFCRAGMDPVPNRPQAYHHSTLNFMKYSCQNSWHEHWYQTICPDTMEWFRQACESDGLPRRALAREFCEREQWFDSAGRLNRASASPVLAKMAGRLEVELPNAMRRPIDVHPRPGADYLDREVSGTIHDLGTLSLVSVVGRENGRCWESMLETHHPMGWHRAPGGLIQYWIISSSQGVLGGLGFSAVSIQLAPGIR